MVRERGSISNSAVPKGVKSGFPVIRWFLRHLHELDVDLETVYIVYSILSLVSMVSEASARAGYRCRDSLHRLLYFITGSKLAKYFELSSSIRAKLKKAEINVCQCRRLVNRIVGIAKELKVHNNILKLKDSSKVLESFSILLRRATSLVIECGKSEWLKTALIRGNNKEAYKEIHRELTNFLSKTSGFSSKDEAPTTDLLNKEAELDLQDMLEKLKRTFCKEPCCVPFSRNHNCVKKRKNAKKRSQGNKKKWWRNAGECTKTRSNTGECKGTQGTAREAGVVRGEHWTMCLPLSESVITWSSKTKSNIKHDLEKIIEVVTDKSKEDQASDHSLRERDSSASYLQIPRSEIVFKRPIGTGSYGDVYEAEWLGCRMCLKDFPWSGGYGKQWLKQAMPLLKLRHPNVLQLVGFSPSEVDSEQPKVLTEIMQGDIRSLIDTRMKEQNGEGMPFNWCTTLDIMIQVARGLTCMHQNGFMHGDRVLTTNIIIKVCGDYIDARIGDFGVPLDIPVEHIHKYEPRIGDPKGAETARWMAPEVCTGSAHYAANSDIYSFGIFCYELVTSRKPFDHYPNVAAVHSQIVAGNLRPELPSNLDERVASIIKKCWHADPLSRPDAQAIVDALENIQFSAAPIV